MRNDFIVNNFFIYGMAFLDSTVTTAVYRDLGGTSTVKFGTAVYRGYREYRPSLVGCVCDWLRDAIGLEFERGHCCCEFVNSIKYTFAHIF